MLTIAGQIGLHPELLCGDKSVTHRAFILCALAQGKSVVRNACVARDTLSTVKCLESLGAKFDFCGADVTVTPLDYQRIPKDVVFDCGNSGTTARLMAGVAAGLGLNAVFIGDDSLIKRPMDRVLHPLSLMNVKCTKPIGCLFEIFGGRLNNIDYVQECVSAQVKGAVLLAGLFADNSTSVTEKVPTRAHTERLLNYLGTNVTSEHGRVTVKGKGKLTGREIVVPNDISAAAYLLVYGLLKGGVTVKNVCREKERTGFIRVLARAGAKLEIFEENTVCGVDTCTVTASKSVLAPLNASYEDVCDAVDEVPLLAAAALTVKGTSRFEGVFELKTKESDRVAAVINMASACGQKAYVDGDILYVESDGRLPANVTVDSMGDHRIAMCGVLLACLCKTGTVENDKCLDVSCPNFTSLFGINPLCIALTGGTGISNSKSPKLMKMFAKETGISVTHELVPLPDDVSDKDLLDVLTRFDGINITMPFKTRAAKLLNAVVPSVNTAGRNIFPQSTDGFAVIKCLEMSAVDVSYKHLLIVGAGGAAESAIIALKEKGALLTVVNRTQEKAENLTIKYNLERRTSAFYGVLSFIPTCDFENEISLEGVSFVFSAEYKTESNLLKRARSMGIKVCDGKPMLYFQGKRSFELWSNLEVRECYEKFLKEVLT